MRAALLPYNKTFLSFLVFITSGIAAIFWYEPLWMLLPFAWIAFPYLYNYVVKKPVSLFWLLCSMLPLSTELTVTPQLGLDFPDELLLLLLTAIVLAKIIHEPSWFPLPLQKSSLFMMVVIHVLWIVVCCFYSVEPLLSVKFLLAKIWYIVPLVILPVAIIHHKRDFRLLALCFVLPMLLVVIQVLIRQSFYHFSFADVKHAMAPFFRNHVNYSSMLVCLLPVAWALWKLTPVHNKKRAWIFWGMVIGLAGLFFSYSRGSWMALLLGFSAIWLIRKRWLTVVVVIAIACVAASTAWLVTDRHYLQFAPDHDRTIFHEDFGEHLQATIDMKDVSAAERFYRWVAGFRMLAERPVTGFGPNSFYPHYKAYTLHRFETWVSDNEEHSTVHNYFILTALEQGVMGLLIFCVLFFSMLLRTQYLYHHIGDPFYKTIALALGAMIVMMGVVNALSDMIETDKIGSLFWLCVGVIILLEAKASRKEILVAADYTD